MPKKYRWENRKVRENERPVGDFREAVYEGVKYIHLTEDRCG